MSIAPNQPFAVSAFQGLFVNTPLTPIISNRAPTTGDKAPIGTLWIEPKNTSNVAVNAAWILTSIINNLSNWLNITGSLAIDTLTGNSGGAVGPTAGNVNIVGSGAVDVVGNPGTSTLTISVSGTGLIMWHVIVASTQIMAPNNGYISNYAGTLAFTLPLVSAVGDIIEVTSIAQAYSISLNAGQSIQLANLTTTTTTGSITSTALGDSLRMVCTVANTDWTVLSASSTAGFNVI